MIEVITNSGIKYDKNEEVVDVCQAIQEMRMESELLGEQRGERRGEQRGERRGEKRGELKKAKEDARSFYRLGVEVETIAKGVGYPIETVKDWVGI